MLKKLVLILPLLLSACISTYVDNGGPQVDYKDISKSRAPIAVKLEATGSANGKENETSTKRVKELSRQTLINSQVFTIADDNSTNAKIKIKFDERFSGGGAFAKGFLTGFTFGLIGTTSSADMVMDISLELPGKPEIAKQYTQKIYITAGLTAGTPDNSTKVENAAAYDEVIKKLILAYIRDLQSGGAI